eukprot:4758771-Amphidinium_carterae.1
MTPWQRDEQTQKRESSVLQNAFTARTHFVLGSVLAVWVAWCSMMRHEGSREQSNSAAKETDKYP